MDKNLSYLFETNQIEEFSYHIYKSAGTRIDPLAAQKMLFNFLEIDKSLALVARFPQLNNNEFTRKSHGIVLPEVGLDMYRGLRTGSLTEMIWHYENNDNYQDLIPHLLLFALRLVKDSNFKLSQYCIQRLCRYRVLREKTWNQELGTLLFSLGYVNLTFEFTILNYFIWHAKYDLFFERLNKIKFNEEDSEKISKAFDWVIPFQENTSYPEYTVMPDSAQHPTNEFGVEMVCVVWGESVSRQFSDFAIPSLLAASGLQDLLGRRTLFRVFTTTDSVGFIRQGLDQLATLEQSGLTVVVDTDFLKNSHEASFWRGLALREVFRSCAKKNRMVYVFPPDNITGNGIDNFLGICPDVGVAGLSILRAFDSNVRQDLTNTQDRQAFFSQSGIIKNRELVKRALTDWSHSYTRYTYLNKKLQIPERVSRRHDEGSIRLQNAGMCAYLLKLNSKLLDELEGDACWLYNSYGDRYFNALDHFFPWYYGNTDSFRIVNNTDSFFFLDLIGKGSFLNHSKIYATGIPKKIYDVPSKKIQILRYSDHSAHIVHGVSTVDGVGKPKKGYLQSYRHSLDQF